MSSGRRKPLPRAGLISFRIAVQEALGGAGPVRTRWLRMGHLTVALTVVLCTLGACSNGLRVNGGDDATKPAADGGSNGTPPHATKGGGNSTPAAAPFTTTSEDRRLSGDPLASTEWDPTCKQLVAPFDLHKNAQILLELGLNGLWDVATSTVRDWVGNPAQELRFQRVANDAAHKIPYELRATAVRMNWLPMEAEILYGRAILEARLKSKEVASPNLSYVRNLMPKAKLLLEDALKGVEEQHEYKFEVFIGASSDANAVALPGGFIIIDKALLHDSQAARAKFAMAHEVAHVLRRHQTRTLQAQIIDAVSLRSDVKGLARVMAQARTDPAAVVALVLTGKLQYERFYSGQELHSDACAVRVLRKAQPDARQLGEALHAFIRGLPPPEKGDTVGAEATSTKGAIINASKVVRDAESLIKLVSRPIERHPTTSERIDRLNATLKEIRLEEAKAIKAAQDAAVKSARPSGKTKAAPKHSSSSR